MLQRPFFHVKLFTIFRILKELIANNMLTRTTYTVKALQEMDGVLNDEIAKIKSSV